MPSPRWSEASAAPIAPAIAAAVVHAWAGPEAGRSTRFLEYLRQMVGPEVLERIEMSALYILHAQLDAPDGLEVPPSWAWFTICPGCQDLRRTKYTVPQNGRLKLQVLRDREWLSEQFRRDVNTVEIARRLGCSADLVRDWARKHELLPPKIANAQALEQEVARRHRAGEAPGTIAGALEIKPFYVRKVLSRLGLATNKRGHHYFDREWWRVRLEDRRMTLRACAREAGIKPHAATYFVNKFDLQHITRANGAKKRPRKYPQLYDREQLRALIDEHGTYEASARAIGCTSPSLVSSQARKVLGHPPRWRPVPHGRREWWEERLERGMTTWELAEEAGIQHDSAREKLRILGLLTRAYANNAARERGRRSA